MISKERRGALHAAKRAVMRERDRSNITHRDVALVLGLSVFTVERLFKPSDDSTHLRYADMLLMAGHPVTREFVRRLLAPLLEAVDAQQLRVVDLQGMANDAVTVDLVRMILRPTVDKLWPANTTQTEAPERKESST